MEETICRDFRFAVAGRGLFWPDQHAKIHVFADDASTNAKKKSIKRTRGLARAKKRGQQKIDNSRTQAIQEALIREHYLDGDATGKWDSNTQRACDKYQADHGWQTKVVPDSRALINLGLGPDHDHLLNPETAMTSSPAKPHAAASTDQSRRAIAAAKSLVENWIGKVRQGLPAHDSPWILVH